MRTLETSALVILAALPLMGCSRIALSQVVSASAYIPFSFQAQNYCPNDGFRIREVFAFNSSAVIEGTSLLTDYDRDGLSDNYESNRTTMVEFNIHPKLGDTNSDGYSDFTTAIVVGYNAANQNRLPSCPNPLQDSDRDGLTDCEEALIRTDYANPDTDGDTVPDGVETRFGLNPLDSIDALTDIDQDGWTALQEIKNNTPHTYTNNGPLNGRSFIYSVDRFRNASNQECAHIMVQNIPYVMVANGNMIVLLVLESKILQGQGEVFRLARTRVLVPSVGFSEPMLTFQGIEDVVIDARTGLPFSKVGAEL